jgi:hypothetical protein
VTWRALPPPVVEPGVAESGAFYKFGDRIHAMFGAGGMWAYSADEVTGPYGRAGKNALLLAPGHTYFSRFFPTPEGILVNHHSMTGEKHEGRMIKVDTHAAPLKLAGVDDEGILRFRYWKGNEALKGEGVEVAPRPSAGATAMAEGLDFGRGIVVEGTVRLPRSGSDEPAALRIAADEKHYAIRIRHDGCVEMGTIDEKGGSWERRHGVDRQWKFGPAASLRLLARRGMLELYLDDHFMECWTMGCHRARKIAIIVPGEADASPVRDVEVWRMSLPGWEAGG